MLIISSIVFALFLLIAVIFLLTEGITGYIFLSNFSHKPESELVFFLALTGIIILSALWFFLLLKAQKRTHTLNSMIDTARMNGIVDYKKFAEFGNFGKGLQILFMETDEISRKRAQRIRFLNSTVSILFSLTNQPILFLDTEGIIIQVSPSYKNTFALQDIDILGQPISKFHKDFSFEKLCQTCLQLHDEVSFEVGKVTAQLIPVYSSAPEPDGYIISFGKGNIFNQKIKNPSLLNIPEILNKNHIVEQVNDMVSVTKDTINTLQDTTKTEIEIRTRRIGLFSRLFKKK